MRYFDLKVSEKDKKAAKKELKDAELYLFGSILTKKFSPRSDIDVAIVSDSFKNDLNGRARILTEDL